MKHLNFSVFIPMLVVSATAVAGRNHRLSDADFLNAAAAGQQSEISLGKLATTNGSSAFIKSFGMMMVKDHGAALKSIQALAKKKGMTASAKLDKEQQETYDRLSKLHGAAFDKAYRADMIDDHKKDLSEFQKESTKAKDADIKAFAKKCVPVVQKHLKAIETGKMPMMK